MRLDEDSVVQGVVEILRKDSGAPSTDRLDEGWRRLHASLDKGEHLRAPAWWARMGVFRLSLAGAAAALLLVAGLRYLPSHGPAPLVFEVRGASADPSGVVTASTSAALLFSDESRVETAAATVVQVRETDSHGATVDLQRGALEVYVKPRSHTSWRFQAGPYTVAVKGTAFHLGFDPGRGRLDVQMRSGAVQIRGPQPDRVIDLRAGESLQLFADPVASSPGHASAAFEAPVPQTEPAPSAPAGEPSRATPRKSGARSLPHAAAKSGSPLALATASTKPSFAEYMAQGDFAAIVREAEQRGLNVFLATASSSELTALADAARYIHRAPVARQALLSIRARFPNSERSKDAAFFLGRLVESDHAGPEAAITWYETYLQEAPRGAYAALALGREMALLGAQRSPRAKDVAKDYLERFPTGNHADLARSLVH